MKTMLCRTSGTWMKTLRPGGVIACDDADYARVMEGDCLCSQTRPTGYSANGPSSKPEPAPGWLRPVPYVRRFLKTALTRYVPRQLLKTELARTDVSRGPEGDHGRCVAVTKLSDETRGREFYSDL